MAVAQPPSRARNLVAHTPDPRAYHDPNASDHEVRRYGVGATMIPRARPDGRSLAFDPTVAGVAHVDPYEEDGGVVVDFSELQEGQIKEAEMTSSYTHEVLYKLGKPPQLFNLNNNAAPAETQMAPGQPAVRGGDYVVPASNPDGSQLVSGPIVHAPVTVAPAVVPRSPQGAQAMQSAIPNHISGQDLSPEAALTFAQRAAAPDPGMAELRQMIGALANTVAHLANTSRALPKVPPKEALPEDWGGFETLQVPFLRGPQGLKAERQIYFELQGFGKIASRYHEVIATDKCLILVYDTRYEGGQEFEPPETSDDQVFLVSVPHLSKRFICRSAGIRFNMGALDFFVLIVGNAEETGKGG